MPQKPSGSVESRSSARAEMIRKCTLPSFTIGASMRSWRAPKMPAGIDLFVGRCIEGVQLATAAAPVTYPPQLTWRQPPKRLGVGACSGFGRSRSERVFGNEFPYFGRVGPAAWAGFRLVGGDGIVRDVARLGRAGSNPGPGPG